MHSMWERDAFCMLVGAVGASIVVAYGRADGVGVQPRLEVDKNQETKESHHTLNYATKGKSVQQAWTSPHS